MIKNTDNKNLTVKDFFAKIKELEDNQDVVFELQVTNKFKKSVHLSYARNFDLQLLYEVLELLAQDKSLPEKNYAHKLKWSCLKFTEKYYLCPPKTYDTYRRNIMSSL